MTKIKQVFIPYDKWEDYINGMWRRCEKTEEDVFLLKAIEFMGDYVVYGSAMLEVSEKWVNTMMNSLTNPHINRRAFLGHCAVCYALGIPEYITRIAWRHLTEKQRIDADNMAQKTINSYLINYANKNRGVHKGVGTQMLFEWDS